MTLATLRATTRLQISLSLTVILILFIIQSASAGKPHAKSQPLIIDPGGERPVFLYYTIPKPETSNLSTTKIIPLAALSLYKKIISRPLGQKCNFHPTCSEFSRQAFQHENLISAMVKTADRLCRDHGFIKPGTYPVKNGHYYDPCKQPAIEIEKHE